MPKLAYRRFIRLVWVRSIRYARPFAFLVMLMLENAYSRFIRPVGLGIIRYVSYGVALGKLCAGS